VRRQAVIACRYHASCCGAHFTSLRAFDVHRAAGHCDPEGAGLLKQAGVCNISEFDAETGQPLKRIGAIWSLEGAERVRARFEARERLNRPSPHAKSGALVA
jgi:hypothetical protein